MAKYINKDILMAQIDKWDESARNGTNPNCKNGNEYEAAMDIAIMVEEAPAADVVEVVHGYWKNCEIDDTVICSQCSHEHYIGTYHEYDKNYCPNCGARMDGNKITTR